jgi:pimeloyl-ACP methyl ester carboxylesterase
MSAPPAPEPLFLPADPDPVFATLHRPAPDTGGGAGGAGRAAARTAVILCPPFGWEEVSSYRSLRSWAERLAAAGHPALRVSLPGTGDSGGSPRDEDRVEAWIAAVGVAAGRLIELTGAGRVVAVGIGLGGMVACLAAAGGAPIDDLVLWSTPARGRTMARQLRAFSSLERSMFYEGMADPPPPPEGELEVGGFVLTAQTRAAVEAIDLTTLELGVGNRRALLLERDGLAADAGLEARLQSIGVAVTVAPGDGFGAMTSTPQLARPPLAVIETVQEWLAGEPAGVTAAENSASSVPAVTVSATAVRAPVGPVASLRVNGVDDAVRETAISIPGRSGQLSAVLSEPAGRRREGVPCVILLNAGAVRRIGPSRLWVEAARRWAADGVPVVRLDMEAIGDSDGDEAPYREDAALYTPTFVPQVIEAMDHLQARGAGQQFVLGGLCSGAFWSFHAALRDPRVDAVLLLNPRALIWRAGLGPGRDLRALLTQRPSLSKIRRLATGPRLNDFLLWIAATPLRLLRRLRSHESEAAATERQLADELRRLVSSGRRVLFLFSAHEPLHAEMERTGRIAELAAASNATVEYVDVRDHTMRPGWAQRDLHAALDRALAATRWADPTAPATDSVASASAPD